jgi:hypothetical protein
MKRSCPGMASKGAATLAHRPDQLSERMFKPYSLTFSHSKKTVVTHYLISGNPIFFEINESVPGSGTTMEQAPQGHKLPVLLPSPGCPVPGPMSKGVEPLHPSVEPLQPYLDLVLCNYLS